LIVRLGIIIAKTTYLLPIKAKHSTPLILKKYCYVKK